MYIIRSTSEAWSILGTVPDQVLNELVRGAAILESEYVEGDAGGYAIVVQSPADLEEAKQLLDHSHHICEWAT